ncbi:MAG TPA: cupredoxin domain-containing protein [Methylocella sp.]|nr:cupredoxin domain-containing protein [Methylocella sp.]
MRAIESGKGLAAIGKPLPRLVAAALFLGSPASHLSAADEPIFTITFKDGALSPNRLEVPANTRFQLQLVNDGDTPVEIESNELHKEKVVAPKTASTLIIRTLDPGEYPFFDDFHPETPPALLVAK